ncbi:MAG: hypothetical protein HC772_13765 [Leptolyngbyaceae cyanobacterium CRU_2_3]|nr:hypothetical protein [Leptolyngbyaceae cyanobacterium CRU_2_3]
MRISYVIRGLTSQNSLLSRVIAGSALGCSALTLLISSVSWLGLATEPAIAQSPPQSLPQPSPQSLPTCQPPRANQFLLLVLNQKADTRSQLQQLLPANAMLTICDYLSNNVVRVEGFSSADIANAWAKYISDRAGLRAFVAHAADSTNSTPVLAPPSAQTASPTDSGGRAYNPQPLGAGYAVLVNYFSQPEVATAVGQVTASTVGLAAYNQHPYLLAIHTTNEATAASLLRTLSDRGFTAVIVDSRRVMLLAPNVTGTGRS